jgi:type I restriction enzyme M protein
MNHQALSSFIWSVADLLRGDYKQSEYRSEKPALTVTRLSFFRPIEAS